MAEEVDWAVMLEEEAGAEGEGACSFRRETR